MSHVIGTDNGSDVQAFEVCISYSRAACERLGMAILKHGLRVTRAWAPNGFVRGIAIHLIVTVPADNILLVWAEIGDADWKVPARPSVPGRSPDPTWGELRDQVEALLKGHNGQMLPCGHPSVLLVFDPIDGATYTCPLCRRQQALEASLANGEPR